MHNAPDFFQIGVRVAEGLLQIILPAHEPGILRPFVSGEVAVVLSVDAKHGAGKRGGADESCHYPGICHCEEENVSPKHECFD
jgi:hypothetical protein